MRTIEVHSLHSLLKRGGLRRAAIGFMVFAIVLGLVLAGAALPGVTAANVDVLDNGGFEEGFNGQAGCGLVGNGWRCFTNGGAANYSYLDDTWAPVVAEGAHSQFIGISTRGIMPASADRYAGIYQTVQVTARAQYSLRLKGLIRTTEMQGDPWRYRVQVGWNAGQTADWAAVTDWVDVGWDTYYGRTSPGDFSTFSTSFTAEDNYVTIYVRVWKKWGTSGVELDVNLDDIRLLGPSPGNVAPATKLTASTATPTLTATPSSASTATPTSTATPPLTPTETPTLTATPPPLTETPASTATLLLTPTATSTSTVTPLPTPTATPTPTSSADTSAAGATPIPVFPFLSGRQPPPSITPVWPIRWKPIFVSPGGEKPLPIFPYWPVPMSPGGENPLTPTSTVTPTPTATRRP